MAKLTTSAPGAIILQAGYDAYTDTGHTTPATTDGALVAGFFATGLNLVQATSNKRWILKTAGGPPGLSGADGYFLRLDGSLSSLTDAAVTWGPSYTLFIVSKWNRRSASLQTLLEANGTYTYYTYNATGHFTQWDGAAAKDLIIGTQDHWAIQGVSENAGTLTAYRDTYVATSVVGSALTAQTGVTIGTKTNLTQPSQVDIHSIIAIPTAVLSAGNLAQLFTDVAAYFGSNPFPVTGSTPLVLWEGNSLFAAGSNASDTAHEQQQVARGLLTGTLPDIRSVGQAGDSMSQISARASYIDAYPALVGRTRANSVLVGGEGYNDSSAAAAFISYIQARVAAGWGRIIIMLPCYTSGWAGAGGDAGVTAWYNTIKGTSFAVNVAFADYRGGGFGGSYAGGDFSDAVHWNDTGHGKAGAIIAVPLQTALNALLPTSSGLIIVGDRNTHRRGLKARR